MHVNDKVKQVDLSLLHMSKVYPGILMQHLRATKSSVMCLFG